MRHTWRGKGLARTLGYRAGQARARAMAGGTSSQVGLSGSGAISEPHFLTSCCQTQFRSSGFTLHGVSEISLNPLSSSTRVIPGPTNRLASSVPTPIPGPVGRRRGILPKWSCWDQPHHGALISQDQSIPGLEERNGNTNRWTRELHNDSRAYPEKGGWN